MAQTRVPTWIGIPFILIGLFIVVAVRLDPSGARAPLFVLDAAAGAFFFAGVSVTAESWGFRIASRLSSLLVVYLLAVPGLWLMFDDGAGSCTSTVAFGGASTRTAGDPTMCRAVFGAGGLLVLAVALALTWAGVRKLFGRQKPDGAS
jgi:hypothetical protein